jgi:hypothetical protein
MWKGIEPLDFPPDWKSDLLAPDGDTNGSPPDTHPRGPKFAAREFVKPPRKSVSYFSASGSMLFTNRL